MPSFNQARFIERSIDSVFQQDYPNVELIVMDGGSTDGTLDILRHKSKKYEHLEWTSTPDRGPGDAINKALQRARGEIIGWLNSDDLYLPGAVWRAVQAFEDHPDWILCYGHGQHINAKDEVIGVYPTRRPEVGLRGFVAGCFICQPTIAFKTSMLTMIGNLDERQKTSFDYEFWLRAFAAFPDRIGFIDAIQAQSRLHEDCLTVKMRRTVAVEGVRLTHQYFGEGAIHWISTYLEEVRGEMSSDVFVEHALRLISELGPCLAAEQLRSLRASVLESV